MTALLPCPFCSISPVERRNFAAHPAVDGCVLSGFAIAEDRRQDWNRRAPVAVPAGWQLVPKEATQGMRKAGRDALLGRGTVGSYAAMLAAAPPPPAPDITQEPPHV